MFTHLPFRGTLSVIGVVLFTGLGAGADPPGRKNSPAPAGEMVYTLREVGNGTAVLTVHNTPAGDFAVTIDGFGPGKGGVVVKAVPGTKHTVSFSHKDGKLDGVNWDEQKVPFAKEPPPKAAAAPPAMYYTVERMPAGILKVHVF